MNVTRQCSFCIQGVLYLVYAFILNNDDATRVSLYLVLGATNCKSAYRVSQVIYVFSAQLRLLATL
jgi:hypothetical protein